MTMNDLTPILERLDRMNADLAYVVERQRAQEELLGELVPIGREVMSTAIGRLDALDQKGYFTFASELAGVAQRVIEGFSPDDVRQLGDAIVGILGAVRSLTRPEVLQIAIDATQALEHAEDVKPIGIFGMVRATRNDDVQKGMALMVEVLRRVGHGVNAIAERDTKELDRKTKLAELLGPRRSRRILGVERPQLPAGRPPLPSTAPACATPKPTTTAAVIDGIAYSGDGHMVDASAWTPELGEAIAHLQGITLTPGHLALIAAARADFAATQVSPNIRRLTQIAGVTTKDIYLLFPKAPGRTLAKIAGLPKPAGCL
jgi:tRNA 2-thiouridine synthesizing protein E